jgi:hypothetical protein
VDKLFDAIYRLRHRFMKGQNSQGRTQKVAKKGVILATFQRSKWLRLMPGDFT